MPDEQDRSCEALERWLDYQFASDKMRAELRGLMASEKARVEENAKAQVRSLLARCEAETAAARAAAFRQAAQVADSYLEQVPGWAASMVEGAVNTAKRIAAAEIAAAIRTLAAEGEPE